MKFHVRKVKNGSGNISVQVITRPNRQNKIEKHIGTAKTKEDLERLVEQAHQFIQEQTKLQPLPFNRVPEGFFEQIEIKSVLHTYAYEFYEKCYSSMGFGVLESDLVKDLAIIRLVEPSSKIKAIELLSEYFDISYSKNTLYRGLSKAIDLKQQCEEISINFAKKHFGFDFNVVF